MLDKYIHVLNLEDYHPGYKDRTLIWCKIYFTMINADPEFEMIEEIDKWRLIAFIMLELQIKKPIPLDEEYLRRKGFNLKKRPISKTIQMLHNFIEVVTQDLIPCSVEKSREEYIKKSREEKNREEEAFLLPEWIPKETWNNYLEMRKKIKKPMTSAAKDIAVKKLIELTNYPSNDDAVQIATKILNCSVFNNWQGLFPLKENEDADRQGTAEGSQAQSGSSKGGKTNAKGKRSSKFNNLDEKDYTEGAINQ